MKLVSVVLSGGAGTRLWPASRQAYPKPFMKVGGSSLLSQAILRGQACGTDELLVVTNEDYLLLTRSQLEQMDGAPHAQFLLEPKGRNTAPAIALAALHCSYSHGADTVMMVLPADHLIPDTRTFVACAMEAAQFAQQGRLMVFGIEPTSPDTGFGYLEVAEKARTVQPVRRFVEKPDQPTAREYLAEGRYLWNSGMFCFTAQAMLDALALHAPQVLETARAAMQAGTTKGDVTRFEPRSFGMLPDISIDYAVMEKASNVSVVPARFGWSDVGSWPAVAQAHPADASGNTFLCDVVSVDTQQTHVQVESHCPKVVATVGVRDLVIVDTPDALLVAHVGSAQKIKSVVDALKARGHPSTEVAIASQRPWGSFVVLKEEPGYRVRRLTVRAGESLSLKYHRHRTKHWMVVQGSALIQVGDERFPTGPGQYRNVPAHVKHRLSNVDTEELVLIEVQYGAYLGEDDVIRLEDSYGRT